jgi:hypothetical protein
MSGKSQRKATSAHRRRAAARGLVRVEIQAARNDAGLIWALVQTLRSMPKKAKALQSALEEALIDTEIKTASDVFGSDVPDEVFAGVFDRLRNWRQVDL